MRSDDDKKQTIEFYDNYASQYDMRGSESKTSCELFAWYLGANSFVLDIGCGTGKDMLTMKQLGLNVFGVDASVGMINIARQRELIVYHMDFENQNFLEIVWFFYRGHFDGIWSRNALLHTTPEKFVAILQTVQKLLRKKGMLFLGMKESNTGKIEIENKTTKNGTTYYCYWPRGSLIDTVEAIGFEFKMLVVPGKDSFGERNILEIFFISK